MSLFSRLFGKAPAPASPSPEKPPETVAPAKAAPDRALATAQEERELQAAIDTGDMQAIGRFVLEGSSTRIRQQAAQVIEDPAQLRQLIKDVRGGNDKSVYKILTTRRDAQLAQARQLEQLQAEIAAAAAALERHSRRTYDALYTPSLDQLQLRWQAVASQAEASLQQSAQDAIDRGREVIAQHLRQVAAVASRELAAANAAAEAQRVRELEAKEAATVAAERAQVLEAERKAAAEKKEAELMTVRQVGGLLRKAHGALAEGSTGRAAGLRRAIDEKIANAPPLPPHLVSQLQHLDEKLTELKDWKSFTVAPKRVELIEEMESLVGATIEPAALAERIKTLQEDWRTLNKGAGENADADWQRFHDAAQKAYEPCREYFAAQGLLRQENLQRRAALLQRLSAFESGHDWNQPDWRTVATALRESRQEWRQHSPVDRAAGKALQQKFAAVWDALQARMDAEHARNIKEKKLLIERAQRLVGAEDGRQAGEEIKALQVKWREVGMVPREEDQRLWTEFRQHCDAVFSRRQHEASAFAAELEANKAKAVALCEEAEKIATLAGEELLAGAARVPELGAAFEAVGELPKADVRGLRARLDRALERCEKAVARQEASNVERSWAELLEVAKRVRAYRAAAVASHGEAAALKQAVDDYLAGVSHWPKGGLEAVKKALAKVDGSDFAANEAALRTLCIRAEILADVPTPTEDQPLRREYQVQRLVKGMGQGGTADESQIDDMTLEWIGVGPTEEATYLVLLERFKRCRERVRL